MHGEDDSVIFRTQQHHALAKGHIFTSNQFGSQGKLNRSREYILTWRNLNVQTIHETGVEWLAHLLSKLLVQYMRERG